MKFGMCKFCGQKSHLIKAHIIPQAFHDRLADGQNRPMLSNPEHSYALQRCPTGIYDTNLVCRSCENRWNDWETYGIAFLKKHSLSSLSVLEGKVICPGIGGDSLPVSNYDYEKLKLFFLSLLWRAGASGHGFCQRIQLGEQLKDVAQLIVTKSPGKESEFTVLLGLYDYVKHPLAVAVLDPAPCTLRGTNFYKFSLAGYVAYIKRKGATLPDALKRFALSACGSSQMLLLDWEASKDRDILNVRHGL